MDPTPKQLVHWIYKEMHANKKTMKYTIPQLLLSVIAKIKWKESAGSDFDAGTSSDFSWFELWVLGSKLSSKGKIMQEQQRVALRPLVIKKIIHTGVGVGGGGQKQ